MHHPLVVTLEVPAEFIALCHAENVEPGTVLRGFIADLCGLEEAEAGYLCNGEWEHILAVRYFEHVGYGHWLR